MKTTINQALNKAAMQILAPLVRVLLRNGVACADFEQLVRRSYVEQGFAAAAEGDGKATVSSVSAKTGLSRKEVKRLLEQDGEVEYAQGQKYNRAVRVISGWLNDPRFCNAEGLPVPLLMEGDQSFASLVKDYSGDIPTRAMLDLLQQSGCVEKHADRLHLVSHAYVPGNDPIDLIDILGTDSHELMQTVVHNMTADQQHKHFQRKVSSQQLDRMQLPAFQKYANRRAQALLEELDSWLSEHQASSADEAEYVSLGIYFYRSSPEKESSDEKTTG